MFLMLILKKTRRFIFR